MAATAPPVQFGWKAPDFALLGVDQRMHALDALTGEAGTVIVFMCNHCPYVKAILDRLIGDALDLRDLGVNVIAVNSNDPVAYPEDSFAHMQELSDARKFPFPYLYDETQGVARAYDAQCTPDFFGFNADMELQYRGRIDASRKTSADGARRDLYEAMRLVAKTGRGPKEQIPSIGCSIKWKK